MVSSISWLVSIGLINLGLFLVGLFLFIPREQLRQVLVTRHEDWMLLRYLLIIFSVMVVHLIEVNVFDPLVSGFVGWDFAAWFVAIEDSWVVGLVDGWHPWVVSFFVMIYIAVYPFILWFSVLYFVLCREIRAIRTLAWGSVLVYLVALPFYLFFPVSNVYTFFGIESTLEKVFPGVEQFFYSTTTSNNCFPSLHTAMALLVVMAVWQTKNTRFRWFTVVVAVLVLISVVYLAIHWLVDVFAGMILVMGVSFIFHRWFGERDNGDSWFRRGRETGN